MTALEEAEFLAEHLSNVELRDNALDVRRWTWLTDGHGHWYPVVDRETTGLGIPVSGISLRAPCSPGYTRPIGGTQSSDPISARELLAGAIAALDVHIDGPVGPKGLAGLRRVLRGRLLAERQSLLIAAAAEEPAHG